MGSKETQSKPSWEAGGVERVRGQTEAPPSQRRAKGGLPAPRSCLCALLSQHQEFELCCGELVWPELWPGPGAVTFEMENPAEREDVRAASRSHALQKQRLLPHGKSPTGPG